MSIEGKPRPETFSDGWKSCVFLLKMINKREKRQQFCSFGYGLSKFFFQRPAKDDGSSDRALAGNRNYLVSVRKPPFSAISASIDAFDCAA